MAIDFPELFNNSDHQHLEWARRHTAFCLHSSFHPYPSFLGYILKWLPFPSEKTGVERDQHHVRVIQLGRGDGRIEPRSVSLQPDALPPVNWLHLHHAKLHKTNASLPLGCKAQLRSGWSRGSFSPVFFSPARLQHSEAATSAFSAWSSWAVVGVKSWNAVLALAGLGVLFSVGTCIIIIVIERLIIGCAPLMALLLSAHADSTSSTTSSNTFPAAIIRIPWNAEANTGGPRSARSSRLVYAAGLDGAIFIVTLGTENQNEHLWGLWKGLLVFYHPVKTGF